METTKVSDKDLKDQGATLVVGMSGLKNKTPDWINKISNGIIFAAMAWALLSMQITEIPEEIKADITRWLMIGTGFIKLSSKFFGLQLPSAE